jgi:RNA polymerase sigma-70 factor (ECF subfamily)
MEKVIYNEDGEWDISDEGEQAREIERDIDTFLALKRLPPKQREVMQMRMDGYSYEEIAEKMGISPRTVQKHIELASIRIRQFEV